MKGRKNRQKRKEKPHKSSLGEYAQKRHFKKTTEPIAEKKLSTQRRFVIHRHDARNLHFDIRLESQGVLKSWAAPKGLPSYKGDKKLAVFVEDHPVDYLKFKGNIAQGEYGAGSVEIWDTGTYRPIGNLEEGLVKGHISFYLDGDKVKGSFTLTRFRNEKYWLILIHDLDDFMYDLRKYGKSSTILEKIEPMKSILIDKPFDSDDYFFEIKWDGVRAVSYVDGTKFSILSRNQFEQSFRYPELKNLPDVFLGKQVVVDGEIVVLNEMGVSSFEMLQQRMNLQNINEINYWSKKMPVIYFIFDLLYLDGRDLTNLPLNIRRKILEKIIMTSRNVMLSELFEKNGIYFYQAAKEKGLEGIMAKRKESGYQFKRSSEWKKLKIVLEQEVVIGGFTEPRSSRAYFGALLLGVFENGRFIYVGHAGTGFSQNKLEELYGLMVPLEVSKSPFEEVIKTNEKAHWVKPKLVAEVKFSEWTKAGKMRQPVFLGLRSDIKPEDVVRELPRKTA